MQIRTHIFQNMSDLIDYARTTPGGSSQKPDYTRGWSGVDSLDEAIDLAVTGWDEPRAKVQQIVDRITPEIRKVVSVRFDRQPSARGRKVLAGRMAQGHPRHTMQRVRTEDHANKRTVTICVNGSFSAGVAGETITKMGAALLALVDALHYMGISTEVWVSRCVTNGSGREYQSAVKVKGFEDQAGTDRLMFAVAHPAMLRRLQFAVFEADGEVPNFFAYGMPAAPKVEGMTFDVTMGANPYAVQEAADDPVAWVLTQIEGLSLH